MSSTDNSLDKMCIPENQQILSVAVGIQGIFGFLSLFLYILNITALRRLKQSLKGPFGIYYTTAAISSCVYFTVHFIFKRFFKLGYFCESILYMLDEPNWFIVLAYRVPSTYCPLLILVINALISFHRVTVVVFPMKSRMFWEEYSRHFLVIALLVPFIFMWFVIISRGYAYIYGDGGIGFKYERFDTFIGPLSASMFSAIAGGIFGSFTLICTIVVFVTTKTIKTDKGMMIFEFLLAIFTLIYAFSQVSSETGYIPFQACLYVTAYYISNKAIKEFVEWNRIYLIDLFILPQAWTLLFCNKNVRREAASMLGIKTAAGEMILAPRTTTHRSSLNH